MGTANATISGDRIVLRTHYSYGEFEYVLGLCKQVPGARFYKNESADEKYWHYPLSIDTCLALRKTFGEDLRVGLDLAEWYKQECVVAATQRALGAATDASLPHVPAAFANWLRGYQRAGAAWVARGYRGAGLIGDTPGLGKTTEVLAGLLEAKITGPVLVVCPKASVKSVWGKEIKQHMPGVPVYLCHGSRKKRTRELDRLHEDMKNSKVSRLRIVVVVAEMLRVEMGDPCYTKGRSEDGEETFPKNKISGMCPQRRKSLDGQCSIHISVPAAKAKDEVPVGFSYPVLFDDRVLAGGWSAVVLDESHKLLGSLNVVKANLMGRGLRLLPYSTSHRRYAMSGTPFGKGGRAEGMFGTLHWLWPDEYTSFWRWIRGVFEVTEVRGRGGIMHPKILGLKGVARGATPTDEQKIMEEFMRSLGPRILRRTKEECLPELPPKNYIEVVCEMTAPQRKQHEQLANLAEIHTSNGIVAPNGSLAFLTRSRQLANGEISKRADERAKVFFTDNSGKLDQLWQALDERGILDGQPGPKVIVASEFNEFLDTIMWRLKRDKVTFFRIDGSTREAQRERMMSVWQNNEPIPPESTYNPMRGLASHPRVMLLNTKAGGLSITLDAADEMHIMDEDPDPGVNEQLEDRIHRASRVHQVTIYYYRTEGTIDFQKAHSVELRRSVQHLLLDGRRGQEYIQRFMKDALEANEDGDE